MVVSSPGRIVVFGLFCLNADRNRLKTNDITDVFHRVDVPAHAWARGFNLFRFCAHFRLK
jgi:hypothetical protein